LYVFANGRVTIEVELLKHVHDSDRRQFWAHPFLVD